jgi:hypothetical protein
MDAEAEENLADIFELLASAGYFRSRIQGLNPFDKVNHQKLIRKNLILLINFRWSAAWFGAFLFVPETWTWICSTPRIRPLDVKCKIGYLLITYNFCICPWLANLSTIFDANLQFTNRENRSSATRAEMPLLTGTASNSRARRGPHFASYPSEKERNFYQI